MLLKKYYGKNLKTAREEAKKELGTDIIVLESVDAKNGEPAVVTVMTEKKNLPVTSEKEEPKKTGLNAILKNLAKKGEPRGTIHQLKDKLTDSLNLEKDGEKGRNTDKNPDKSDPAPDTDTDTYTHEDSDSGKRSKTEPTRSQNSTYNRRTVQQQGNNKDTVSRHKNALYRNTNLDGGGKSDSNAPGNKNRDGNGSANGTMQGEFKQYFDSQQQIQPIQQEVNNLHRRFDQMERLFSEAFITANITYVSHPAFQQLLEAGVQPSIISKWFKSVLSKGIDPYEQQQSFMYELSSIVRSDLFASTVAKAKKHLLFTGPTGSGKTTLIMKLAANPEFMGTRNVALVSIAPPIRSKRYSTLPLFADDFGIPFFKVSNGAEISDLLPKLKDFDYVLFDTAAISLGQEAAVREFWKIRQIVGSVNPIEIHYVVDATVEKSYFKESFVENHPLQPDYVAITHLDETNKWGHLVPYLQSKQCDIRYVSRGSGIPDDIQPFDPGWFAQQILST